MASPNVVIVRPMTTSELSTFRSRTPSAITHWPRPSGDRTRSEEHTSELQSQSNLVCRLLLEKKKTPPRALLHATEIDCRYVPLAPLALACAPIQLVTEFGTRPSPKRAVLQSNHGPDCMRTDS